MENVRERIYENIRALSKMYDIKIGDVERRIGVTPGYLSRKSHGLTIEKVCQLSEIFQITIDKLIKKDLWEDHKWRIAEKELIEATKKARKTIDRDTLLEIVNDAIAEE